MKIAILSRPGSCFPNIISIGLAAMLNDMKIENKIFDDSIPFLMRLLPLWKKPKRWHNNFQYRLRNKLKYYFADRRLLKELNKYDAIIISECYPNAFWKNYFALDQLKKIYKGKIISYTDAPLDAAPLHKLKYIDVDDYKETDYDFNLFVTDTIENKFKLTYTQAQIGFNIAFDKALIATNKKEFIAVVDFAQPGFENFRDVQMKTLEKLGIKTIVLEGKYEISEIRKIYQEASVFFLSFPETIGLPIAECLACGTYIFAPFSNWPMAWQLEQTNLPNCFQIYEDEINLEKLLKTIKNLYDFEKTPTLVLNTFLENYIKFYCGKKDALENLLKQIN